MFTVMQEMFVRMLAVHCVQNNSYEITMNSYQGRKVSELRKVPLILSIADRSRENDKLVSNL